jgi:PAS domain S-box-containing protein
MGEFELPQITQTARPSAPLNPVSCHTPSGFSLSIEDLIHALDLAQAMVRKIDGTILYATSGISRLYGWTQEEMVGRCSHELLQTQFPKLMNEIETELLESGQWTGELKHRKRDGSTLWVASHWALRHDEHGFPAIVIEVNNDITAQKRVEQSLRETSAVLRAVNESTTDLIYIKDRNGRIVMANPATGLVFGRHPEEIIGKTDWELGVSRNQAEIDRYILETGKSEVLEETLEGPAGTQTFLLNRSPYHDECGNITGLITIAVDITDRKRAEAALLESEERLRLAVDSTGLGTFDYCPGTGRLIWSDFARRQFGLSPEADVNYDTFLRGLHPDDRDRVNQTVQNAMLVDSGGVYAAEYRTVGIEDGKKRWLSSWGRVYFDENGTPLRFVGMTLEITERKRAEQAQRESELRERARAAELKATMDAVPAAIFIATDPECREILGNGEAYRLLRLAYGRNLSKSMTKRAAARGFRLIKNGNEIANENFPVQLSARLRRPVQDYEFDLIFDDGSRICMLGNAVPLSSETGTPRGAVGAFVDITELRNSQRLLEESRDRQRTLSDRLLRAQDDERRRIAQDLHDDLCQKLAFLAFEVRNLTMSRFEGELMREHLGHLHERVVSISQHLRNVAYQLHPSAVDDLGLAAALQALCEEFSRIEGIRIRFMRRGLFDAISQEIASCLYRVTQEALRNISKHARAGRATVSLSTQRNVVRLAIADTGAGFQIADVKTGLGIPGIEERVRRVNGDFSIASEPGKGTNLTIRIPLTQGPPEFKKKAFMKSH